MNHVVLVRANRGADMSLYRLFRLKPALAGLLLVLFVASTQAADYIPAGSPIPQGIKWVGGTATGANTSAYAKFQDGSLSKFPVPVGSGTLGQLVKGALKKAGPAAAWYQVFKGLVDGAGWAISELQDQVVVPGTDPVVNPTGTQVGCYAVGSQLHCSATRSGAASMILALHPAGFETCTPNPGKTSPEGYWWNLCRMAGQSFDDNVGAVTQTLSAPKDEWGSGSPESVVNDTQIGDLVKYTPQVVNAVLIDPDTGAPIRIPELINALNALAANLAAANGDPAPPLVETDPTFGEETTPSQTDWPGFCDWATTVCEFIDWVKAEDTQTEPPEVPFEEQTMPDVEWSSGLGAGSCPSPYQTTVALAGYSQTIEFSVEPICDLGVTVKPLLVALALLLVPMIIGGFRSSKDA